jgi:hypothetical protein
LKLLCESIVRGVHGTVQYPASVASVVLLAVLVAECASHPEGRSRVIDWLYGCGCTSCGAGASECGEGPDMRDYEPPLRNTSKSPSPFRMLACTSKIDQNAFVARKNIWRARAFNLKVLLSQHEISLYSPYNQLQKNHRASKVRFLRYTVVFYVAYNTLCQSSTFRYACTSVRSTPWHLQSEGSCMKTTKTEP